MESLQQMGSDTESAQLVRLTVMLKMAQCQNVLGMHAECIRICTELLELTPDDYTEFVAAACCIRGAAYYTRVRPLPSPLLRVPDAHQPPPSAVGFRASAQVARLPLCSC